MKRVFKAYDRDHAHAVKRRDFERGLKDLRLDRAFSSSEQRELAKAFEDNVGDVKYGSFVDAALGKSNSDGDEEELTDEFVDEALVQVADIASKVESAFGHFVDNLCPSEA